MTKKMKKTQLNLKKRKDPIAQEEVGGANRTIWTDPQPVQLLKIWVCTF